MGLFNRSPKKAARIQGEAPIITIDSIYNGLDYLVELVKQIRPTPYDDFKQADLKFKALFYKLQNDKRSLFSLRKALLSQFLNSNFISALTESGMVGSRGFLQEFITKLKHKVLPPLLHPNDFLYVINHVFYKHHDHIWVAKIDPELWINFFKLLGIEISVEDKRILQQLSIALQILTHRTVTLGLEKEVLRKYQKVDYQNYPFFILENTVQKYLQLTANRY